MKKNSGFSIIEVALSIMIISTAILMIIAIYTTMLKAESKGIGKTIASSLAERVMEEIASDKVSDIKIQLKQLGDSTNTEDIKETLSGKDVIDEQTYYYYAEIYPVSGNYLDNTNLLQIDCTVAWDIELRSITETALLNAIDEKNSVKFSRLVVITDND